MEIWDGYFSDGTLANYDLVRGEPIPQGLYHLVCEVLVRHVDGEYLLMRRKRYLRSFGDKSCFFRSYLFSRRSYRPSRSRFSILPFLSGLVLFGRRHRGLQGVRKATALRFYLL